MMENSPVSNGPHETANRFSTGAPVPPAANTAAAPAGASTVIHAPGNTAAEVVHHDHQGPPTPLMPLSGPASASPTRRSGQLPVAQHPFTTTSSVASVLNSPSLGIASWRGGAGGAGAEHSEGPSAPYSRPMGASALNSRENTSGGFGDRDTTRGIPAGADAFDPTELPTLKYTIPISVTRDGKVVEEQLDPFEVGRLYGQQQAALRKLQTRYDFLAVPGWVRLHPLLGSYLAELVGTFAWVLTLALVSVRNRSIFSVSDDTDMTSLPIGFMFTSMIFTFGYISGSHFNPAVSVAVFLVRQMDLGQCCAYVLCQLAAALAAGVVAMVIQGDTDIFVPTVESGYVTHGIFSELIFTLAICLVVLNIAYSRQSGNFFYGFAVGMTMSAGSASVGRISGGAFNPAAATGLQVAVCLAGSCDELKNIWLYWLAPIVGAVVAAILFSQMAQPSDTQVLEDMKVFQDVNQLHRQRTAAQPVTIDASAGTGQGREDERTYSSSSETSSSASDSPRRTREMRNMDATRAPLAREEKEATEGSGDVTVQTGAPAGEFDSWQHKRPPPAPRSGEAAVKTTREGSASNWF